MHKVRQQHLRRRTRNNELLHDHHSLGHLLVQCQVMIIGIARHHIRRRVCQVHTLVAKRRMRVLPVQLATPERVQFHGPAKRKRFFYILHLQGGVPIRRRCRRLAADRDDVECDVRIVRLLTVVVAGLDGVYAG